MNRKYSSWVLIFFLISAIFGGLFVSFDNNIVKAFKSIDYSAKTMTWKIKLRPLKEPMTGLVITDTFKNDGLTFLPGTVTVTDGLAHTLGFVDTDNDGNTVINYSDGFVMTFTETIPSDKEYIIEYKTSLLTLRNSANVITSTCTSISSFRSSAAASLSNL